MRAAATVTPAATTAATAANATDAAASGAGAGDFAPLVLAGHGLADTFFVCSLPRVHPFLLPHYRIAVFSHALPAPSLALSLARSLQGNLISAGVFFVLSMAKENKSVIGSFSWMCCAIATLAYYAMWAGVGVQYKTTDVTPRVIFWARYVDRFITSPLLLCALSAFAKAEFPVLISLLGADMIMMSCLALGAFVYGPDKYFWWVGALLLFVIMVSQLLSMLAKIEDEKRKEVMRTLTWLTIICWVAYIVLWLLGSEGTAALGLSQEVGLTTVVDLISKAGVLFFLISNMDATDESKATGLTLA